MHLNSRAFPEIPWTYISSCQRACQRIPYNFKCVLSSSPGRTSLTYTIVFFLSPDISITRPLRLIPALRQPLTKRQCLNGFASAPDMAVSVPKIAPVSCPSHWEMMEGPWQSKGRKKWTESWEKMIDWFITGSRKWWMTVVKVPIMRSSMHLCLLKSIWKQNVTFLRPWCIFMLLLCTVHLCVCLWYTNEMFIYPAIQMFGVKSLSCLQLSHAFYQKYCTKIVFVLPEMAKLILQKPINSVFNVTWSIFIINTVENSCTVCP